MSPERFIRKDSCGADFNEVSAEFIFEGTFLMPPEVYPVPGTCNTKISSSGIIGIEAEAPVTLNTPVHLVLYKRPQVLVPVCPFFEFIPPVGMAGHHCHILEMAFTSFIAHRAVVGMIGHETFNHSLPECNGFRITD